MSKICTTFLGNHKPQSKGYLRVWNQIEAQFQFLRVFSMCKLRFLRTHFLPYLISEPCHYLESIIHYHVTRLPNLIDEARKVTQKELQFRVAKSQSQGISLGTAVFLDLKWVQRNMSKNQVTKHLSLISRIRAPKFLVWNPKIKVLIPLYTSKKAQYCPK